MMPEAGENNVPEKFPEAADLTSDAALNREPKAEVDFTGLFDERRLNASRLLDSMLSIIGLFLEPGEFSIEVTTKHRPNGTIIASGPYGEETHAGAGPLADPSEREDAMAELIAAMVETGVVTLQIGDPSLLPIDTERRRYGWLLVDDTARQMSFAEMLRRPRTPLLSA